MTGAAGKKMLVDVKCLKKDWWSFTFFDLSIQYIQYIISFNLNKLKDIIFIINFTVLSEVPIDQNQLKLDYTLKNKGSLWRRGRCHHFCLFKKLFNWTTISYHLIDTIFIRHKKTRFLFFRIWWDFCSSLMVSETC